MTKYIITDGKTKYITREQNSGKFVSIASEKKAMIFENKQKAHNVLANCVNNKIRESFFIEEIPSNTDIKDKISCINSKMQEEIPSSKIESMQQDFETLDNILNKMNKTLKEDSEKLSKVDREILDIRHYIEFSNLNAADGYKAYKLLQNALKRRRVYKDSTALANKFKSMIEDENYKEAQNLAKGYKDRQYSPRELEELF